MKETLHPYTLALEDGGYRSGALVCHDHGNGIVGWGDAAPLGGWSKETLEDVLSRKDIPSLRCGREGAVAAACTFEEWPLCRNEVQVNALLAGNPSQMVSRAHEAADAGCRCFKVKVAGMSCDELRRVLDKLFLAVGGEATFRLDPNRSWAWDEALELASALKGYPIAYVEEPLADAARLPSFIPDCRIPVALDETLCEIAPEELKRYKGAAALVLKPTLMGGFKRARAFAEAGEEHGMVAVVSACFESGVGIYALGRFAASLSNAAAAGLDTYSRLKSDVLLTRLNLSGFVFDPHQPMPPISHDVIAF